MSEMKFNLKQSMIDKKLEVVVFKFANKKFQVAISEVSKYSADDLYYYEENPSSRLRDAYSIQKDMFDYLIKNDFKNVTKRYADIS